MSSSNQYTRRNNQIKNKFKIHPNQCGRRILLNDIGHLIESNFCGSKKNFTSAGLYQTSIHINSHARFLRFFKLGLNFRVTLTFPIFINTYCLNYYKMT